MYRYIDIYICIDIDIDIFRPAPHLLGVAGGTAEALGPGFQLHGFLRRQFYEVRWWRWRKDGREGRKEEWWSNFSLLLVERRRREGGRTDERTDGRKRTDGRTDGRKSGDQICHCIAISGAKEAI